jgi:predicted nucleic acid-binding protein
MNNILIDTGFWIALYDSRDSFNVVANDMFEYLALGNVIIPYPSLYETINTRFVKNRLGMKSFKMLLERTNFQLLDDADYKEFALESTFDFAYNSNRSLSLVDMVIRQMLADERLKIDHLISFNQGDFVDICTRRNIRMLSD